MIKRHFNSHMINIQCFPRHSKHFHWFDKASYTKNESAALPVVPWLKLLMMEPLALTISLRGLRMPQTLSAATLTPSSSLVSLSAVATTSMSDGSLFPPAKLWTCGHEDSENRWPGSFLARHSPHISLVSTLQFHGAQSEE